MGPSDQARRVITGLDLAATTLFALEGALLAGAADFDLFGVLVVAVVSALGGGTIRDLLIGDIPTASVRDVRYPAIAIAGGLVAFVAYRWATEVPDGLLVVLDAGGLALFAVTGSAKAFDRRIAAFSCVMVGVLTAVGGGIIRDLLLGVTPVVLYTDVYATAALLGAVVVVLGLRADLPRTAVLTAGALSCVVLRLTAYALDWRLPTV